MLHCKIRLFGGFSLTIDGAQAATIRTARHQSLLAYLIVNRQVAHLREHVAYLFWPDSSEAGALNNLRKALHLIRHQLPDSKRLILSDAKTIRWHPAVACTYDVEAFADQLSAAGAAREHHDAVALRSHLITAVETCTGELLPGCYDDWIVEPRAQLREQHRSALEELAILLEVDGELSHAMRRTQQMLRIDPINESAHRRLMRLHILNGDKGNALRAYHACASALQREAGLSPSPETVAIYESLAHTSESLTPLPAVIPATNQLIGRDAEWQLMVAAWRQSKTDRSQCIVLTGDAGVGKSRLVMDFCTWARSQGAVTVIARAYAASGALALNPIVDWLRQDTLRTHWRSLPTVWLTELARLMPELLNEFPSLSPPQPMFDSWQRKHLFEALTRAFGSCSQPVILALDDLQWADSESIEWLQFLLRSENLSSVLLICSVRLGELALDQHSSNPLALLLRDLRIAQCITEIELQPLDRAHTDTLALQLSKQKLSQEHLAELFQESGGNPLFITELMRTSLFNGSGTSKSAANSDGLPAKVRAVIESRLSQLTPSAYAIAQTAAVVGSDFAVDVLAFACKQNASDDDFVSGLDELWRRRIVREYGDGTYDFSHAKIRDVVLSNMNPARTRMLHSRVAAAMEQLRDTVDGRHSAQLAVHHHRAGHLESAIVYYAQAAQHSHALTAYRDEIGLLKSGLSAIAQMPAGRQQTEQKRKYLLMLGPAMIPLTGAASREFVEIYEEVLSLAQSPDDEDLRFRAYRGLWLHHLIQGSLESAIMWAERCLELATQTNDNTLIGDAHRCLATATFLQGQPRSALSHSEEAIRRNPPESLLRSKGVLEEGYGLSHISEYALTLWLCGYPEQAEHQSKRGLAFVRESGVSFSLITCLEFASVVACLSHNTHDLRIHIAELSELAQQHGSSDYTQYAEMLNGWLQATAAHEQSGAEQAQAGLSSCLGMSVSAEMTLYAGLCAEALLAVHEFDRARNTIAAGIALSERTGERFWLAELQRLHGECNIAGGRATAEAEADFRLALAIAHAQGALALELRAAISLARMLLADDRKSEALDILSPVYECFGESPRKGDLGVAKELLDRLGVRG